MNSRKAEVVICGAGMAGISAAYHLAVKKGVRNVVLVDERDPLTLTSDKGTEAYRNWWPGPDGTMVRFMNRSIDLLEDLARESGNAFELNQRGYLFVTADPGRLAAMRRSAREISELGAGDVRLHPGPIPYIPSTTRGFGEVPSGADLLLDRTMIRESFPFLADDVIGAMHVRRCGWLNARALGAWLLRQSQARGVRLVRDRIERVSLAGGRVQTIHLRSGAAISTSRFVIAAGPYLRQAGAMLGIELPVFNELHGKMTLDDRHGLVPREVPLMIWNDPQQLAWTQAERAALSASDPWLLDEFPAGVHFRPRGLRDLLIIWTFGATALDEPRFPLTFGKHYGEILLRGLARMIPVLSQYFGEGETAHIDGGYYCKTRENRPLIGPLPVGGAWVIGALSGYGIMASQAAGELLAAHVTGETLPDVAPAFLLERYENPAYQKAIAGLDGSAGQL